MPGGPVTVIIEDLRSKPLGRYDRDVVGAKEGENFKIKKITNSTLYRVGQYVDKKHVDEMINILSWTVHLIEPKK